MTRHRACNQARPGFRRQIMELAQSREGSKHSLAPSDNNPPHSEASSKEHCTIMRLTQRNVAATTVPFAMLIGLLLVLTLSLFLTPSPVFAAGVVGNGSPASCTESALRNAINGGGRVTFNCGPNPVTITFSREIEIKNLKVEIEGANKVTLSGGRRTNIFRTYNATLTVRNLTFRDGTGNKGGAIRATGNSRIVVIGSRFFNNDSLNGPRDAEGGGAISMHQGSLHIETSHFEGNRGINGGAIYNMLAPITVVGSTFVNNDSTFGHIPASGWSGNWGYGGAIYVDGASVKDSTAGQVVIRNSVFRGNKARLHGGAVYTYLYTPDTALIEGSLFEANAVLLSRGDKANGGALMHHNGPLTLRNSTFVGNRSEDAGGAIVVAQSSSGGSWRNSTITNVTVIGNRADAINSQKGNGGALFILNGLVELSNSTITGNFADRLGGAIYSMNDNVRLRNTIISGNSVGLSTTVSDQCYKTFSGSSNNIQSPGASNDTKCASGILITKPLLGSLGNYGGRTPTVPILATSPAINRGASCTPTDQRGALRVAACDIGAFEYGATAARVDTLSAPIVEANANGALLSLNWNTVEGALSYEVQIAAEVGFTDETPTMPVSELSLSLLQNRGVYAVRVRACVDEGCGPFSEPVSVAIDAASERVFLPILFNE